MDDLPPIPTPLHQRWREFRIQILPIIVFVITVGTIVYLWRTYVHTSDVVGAVVTNTVTLVSITEGRLTDLVVDQFDAVAQGQPLGQIVTIDPELTAASLTAIAAELKMEQTRMELDKFRNQDSLLRLRLDLLAEQVALELAQIQLAHSDRELKRANQLYEQQLISEGLPYGQGFGTGLDVARRDRDIYQSEVLNRSNTVARLEQEIKTMAQSSVVQMGEDDPAIVEVIRAKQEELRLLNEPTILKAPIDGVVATLFKRAGEKVIRGDPIAIISTPKSDRIVGYLRQPINQLPTTNDTVIISTRAHKRQVGKGHILKIGAQLEQINPMLLSADASRIEMGLPFLVRLPEGMNLIPGEFVDLQIEYSRQ